MSESKNLLKSISMSIKGLLFNVAAKASPEVMANTALLDSEEKLRKVSKMVAQCRQELKKESAEADLAKEAHEKNVSRARSLKSKIEAETDPAEKEKLGKLMVEVVALLEKSFARLQKENEDVLRAESNLKKVEAALEAVTGNVRNVRDTAESIRGRIKTAQIDSEKLKAENELEQVLAEISGSGSNGSALGASLNALREVADELEVENESVKIAGEGLKSASGDSDINKGLEALDRELTPVESLDEKLNKFGI